MDEFAQSREDDDLFADEFEPVVEPTVVEKPTVVPAVASSSRGDIPRPIEAERTTPKGVRAGTEGGHTERSFVAPTGPADYRNGRGGQGGNRGGGGLSQSRYAPAATTPAQDNENAKTDRVKTDTAPTLEIPVGPQSTNPHPTTNTTIPLNPQPSEPQQPQPQRTAAVRGDRTLTGGPAHKKLTEEELTEKMAKMVILNAQKAERFRLSEEDSAAYARKEKEMAKKRVEEQKNARAMDMERAKNRERKLRAQSGREWDEGKEDSDIVDGRGRGRSSEYVRGGHGGVIRGGGLSGSRYANAADDEDIGDSARPARGRGGGFEIRGRGNRGRGGNGTGRGGKASTATIPGPEDFPELPSKAAASESKVETPEKPAGDWAEEMATPVEEKKIDV